MSDLIIKMSGLINVYLGRHIVSITPTCWLEFSWV